MISSILSTLHILTLALGLPALIARGREMQRVSVGVGDLGAVFHADRLWGLGSALWLGTGLLRVFGPFEKGSAYYLSSGSFLLKVGLFTLLLFLELAPMVTLIRWRGQLARGQTPDLSQLRVLARLNAAEIAVVALIPFLASMMARGIGFSWFT